MECGSILLSNWAEAKKILEDAARERQEGILGQWQQESPFRKVLEQVKGNLDMGCGAQMMRKSYIVTRDGSWEEFKERHKAKEKSSGWTLEKIREAYEKVAREEIGRLGIVREILRKSTDFLRRIILQQFSFGGLHLVGIGGTQRQEEGELQLVVRGLWRQI